MAVSADLDRLYTRSVAAAFTDDISGRNAITNAILLEFKNLPREEFSRFWLRHNHPAASPHLVSACLKVNQNRAKEPPDRLFTIFTGMIANHMVVKSHILYLDIHTTNPSTKLASGFSNHFLNML